MDEKWVEQELGKLANSSVTLPDALDHYARTRIREQASRSKRRNVSMSRIKAIGMLPASALLVVLVFFSTLVFLHFSRPAGGGELALGMYETEDGFAWVELSEGSKFEFCRHIATSYWPRGSFSVQGDELILHVSDAEQYRFTIEGNTIIFQGGDYVESPIKEGTVFTNFDGQGYKKLEQLPDPYPPELAEENGDVVNGQNIEKLDKFVDNFKASRSDWVRITMYTIEGDAIIHDLKIEKGKLTLYIDTTRDKFGTRAITQYEVSDVYKEVRDGGVYYLVKSAGEEIILTYAGSEDHYRNLDNIQVVDITASETNKGYYFTIQTSEEVEDVSLHYIPSSSGESKAAIVLPGVKTVDGLFKIDFDLPQINGMAQVFAYNGSTGVVAGNYRLADDLTEQEYAVPQKQGGKVPQLFDVSMVVDGNRSVVVDDITYFMRNEMYIELSVSDDVTKVEFVFFPEDADPTSALIYPGIEEARGTYRVEFNSDKSGHGYYLLYNQVGDNTVVMRSELFFHVIMSSEGSPLQVTN